MLFVFLFLIVFSVILLYKYLTRNFDHWKNKNVPYAEPLPLVGNFLKGFTMHSTMGDLFMDLYQKTDAPMLGIYLEDEPALLIRDPEILRYILIKDFHYFNNRTVMSNVGSDPWCSYNLFSLKNPEWKLVRNKMAPIFSSLKLKYMFKVVKQCCFKWIDYTKREIETNSILDVIDLCQRVVAEQISSTVFGVEGNVFGEESSLMLQKARSFFDWTNVSTAFQMRACVLFPNIAKLLRLNFHNIEVTSYLHQLFLQIRKERIRSDATRGDLIDIILQVMNSNVINEEMVIAQVINFFGAGFETTSSTMSFLLYEIAKNEAIQVRLRKEMDEVLPGNYKEIAFEDLKKLKYLDQCIKETLRIYPTLPFLDRICNADYKIPNTDLVIAKNTKIFISTLGLHHDACYFPDPEVFNPDRFGDDANCIEEMIYMPFGGGPRFCIGQRFAYMNMKISLAALLKNFTLDVCEETTTKIEFNRNGFMLASMQPIKLRIDKFF